MPATHTKIIDGLEYSFTEFSFDKGMQLTLKIGAILGESSVPMVTKFLAGGGKPSAAGPAMASGISSLCVGILQFGGVDLLNALFSQVSVMKPVDGSGKKARVELGSEFMRDSVWPGGGGLAAAFMVISWVMGEVYAPFLEKMAPLLATSLGSFAEGMSHLTSQIGASEG